MVPAANNRRDTRYFDDGIRSFFYCPNTVKWRLDDCGFSPPHVPIPVDIANQNQQYEGYLECVTCWLEPSMPCGRPRLEVSRRRSLSADEKIEQGAGVRNHKENSQEKQ